MTPTLSEGDWLLFKRVNAKRLPKKSARLANQIVLALAPNGELIVKRVLSADRFGVLVIGDNQERSTDSRHFGTLPWSSIKGQYLFRYWPLNSK